MQRPPSGKGLPIAQATPIHDWINRINGKRTELARENISAEQQKALSGFVERAFVASALGLTGLDVSEEQVGVIQRDEQRGMGAGTAAGRKIQTVLGSIRVLLSMTDLGGASLTPVLLSRIHDPYGGAASGRDQHDDAGTPGGVEAGAISPRIRAFCDWASADSFRELNQLEQAAIVTLRLLEIRPFEEGNVAAALGAGSLFTMRAGWPPIIIPAALRARFNPAVGEGLKMNTRPLVDLVAESIYETLNSMINLAKADSGSR